MPSPMRWPRAGAETVLVSGPVEIAAARRREAAARHHGARNAGGLRSRAARRCRGDARRRSPTGGPTSPPTARSRKTTDRVVPLIKLVENPDILATLARGTRSARAW